MIRFGLLGCGRIAKRHADLLGGNHIDQASLVAVCDPVRARADAIASKFNVPASYDLDDFLGRKVIVGMSLFADSHAPSIKWESRLIPTAPSRFQFPV